MATRIAARYISRRLWSSGKVLSDKEKAAGNIVCIKGPKPSETPAADVKPTGGASSDPNFLQKLQAGFYLAGLGAYVVWNVQPLIASFPSLTAAFIVGSDNKVKTAVLFVKLYTFGFVVLPAAFFIGMKLKAAEEVEGFEEKKGDAEALVKEYCSFAMSIFKALVFMPTATTTGMELEAAAAADGVEEGNYEEEKKMDDEA